LPRICHLITRFILGGAQRLALETCASLRDRGWDVELWTGPQTGAEGSLHEEARNRRLPLRLVPHLVREISVLADAQAYGWLRRELRRERFDILHTHSSKAGILGRLAGADAGVPIRVHSVHGWAMTPETSGAARLLYTALERYAARRTTRLVAVSDWVRQTGLAAGIGRPQQYRVIRGGIVFPGATDVATRSRRRRELGLPEDAVVLGTLGRLDPAKDPLGALEGALPLIRDDPRLHLVFIGDGRLRARMERARERSGLGSRVMLAGLRHDGSHFLPALDVFFLSSRWEGFPLVVIEAMAAGLPVVSFDVAGVREAVEDGRTGYLVPPGDRATWTRRLGELARDASRRRIFGDRGRESARARFSLETMMEETEGFYRALLSGNQISVSS